MYVTYTYKTWPTFQGISVIVYAKYGHGENNKIKK